MSVLSAPAIFPIRLVVKLSLLIAYKDVITKKASPHQ